jgi:hypothetical protein
MTYTQTDIRLTLDMQDGIVEGVALGTDGTERPFTGWLALIQTIDDLMARSPDR